MNGILFKGFTVYLFKLNKLEFTQLRVFFIKELLSHILRWNNGNTNRYCRNVAGTVILYSVFAFSIKIQTEKITTNRCSFPLFLVTRQAQNSNTKSPSIYISTFEIIVFIYRARTGPLIRSEFIPRSSQNLCPVVKCFHKDRPTESH